MMKREAIMRAMLRAANESEDAGRKLTEKGLEAMILEGLDDPKSATWAARFEELLAPHGYRIVSGAEFNAEAQRLRALLKKYMTGVIDVEGVSFLLHLDVAPGGPVREVLSKEELTELQRIEAEIGGA